jgi:hypothetical protein
MDKHQKYFSMVRGNYPCCGLINEHRLESKVRNLEAECVEEGKRNKLESGRLTLICDAEWLASAEHDSEALVGIQARLAAENRRLSDYERWPYVLVRCRSFGFFCCTGGLVFLSRRIRELRDAIIGK